MKIYSKSAKGSKLMKFSSLWPLIGFAFSLNLWFVNEKHFSLLILVILFSFLFIYTLFFAVHELYIDTERNEVVKKIKWLFIDLEKKFKISDYKGIYVSYFSNVNREGGGAYNSRYNVVLIHKYAANNTAYGLNIMENFLLDSYIEDKVKARNIASKYADLLGVNVFIEKQVAKNHPDIIERKS